MALLRRDGRFELAAPPRYGLLCVVLKGASDAQNAALLERLNASGERGVRPIVNAVMQCSYIKASRQLGSADQAATLAACAAQVASMSWLPAACNRPQGTPRPNCHCPASHTDGPALLHPQARC